MPDDGQPERAWLEVLSVFYPRDAVDSATSARHPLTPDESALLRRWVLVANAKGRYSRGSTETYLDQDLAVIRDGSGPSALIERLKLQVGRLAVSAEEQPLCSRASENLATSIPAACVSAKASASTSTVVAEIMLVAILTTAASPTSPM